MTDQFANDSTNGRTSEFTIRTAPMAKAFFAITAAALILAAIFNFTMAGNRSSLIAEQALKKAKIEESAATRREAAASNRQLAQVKPQPFPLSGSVQWRQVYPTGTSTTLLTISDETQNGRNKIVAIHDQGSGMHIANLYLQANSKAYISLPTTLYTLSLTEGDQWLGSVIDFGPKAEKQKVGEVNLLHQNNLVLRFEGNTATAR